jgi:hypothetical protein
LFALHLNPSPPAQICDVVTLGHKVWIGTRREDDAGASPLLGFLMVEGICPVGGKVAQMVVWELSQSAFFPLVLRGKLAEIKTVFCYTINTCINSEINVSAGRSNLLTEKVVFICSLLAAEPFLRSGMCFKRKRSRVPKTDSYRVTGFAMKSEAVTEFLLVWALTSGKK